MPCFWTPRNENKSTIQVILFVIDCAIFYTNLRELFCQFISWTNWVNSGKVMDNCWISFQVMADMKKVYDDLIIINLQFHFFLQLGFSNFHVYHNTCSKWLNLWKLGIWVKLRLWVFIYSCKQKFQLIVNGLLTHLVLTWRFLYHSRIEIEWCSTILCFEQHWPENNRIFLL